NQYLKGSADGLPIAERTVSVWINPSNLSTRPVIMGYGGDYYEDSWIQGINMFGNPAFALSTNHSTNSIAHYYEESPVGQWQHLAISTSSEGTKLYLNGTLMASNSNYIQDTHVSGKELAVGVAVNQSGTAPYSTYEMGYYQGDLDELRIYNRALSEAEILHLYNYQGSDNIPVVSTSEISEIAQTSATSGGVVTSEGGFPVTSRGLVWSTSRFPTVTSNLGISYNGTGAGAFVTELSDLNTSTTYYVRAFATNSQGTSYGQERFFTTLAGEFSGGTGTEEDPYLVSSAEQLYNVRNYLNANFKQTADINLGVEPWNLDQGWEPIGNGSSSFRGTYDGDGHEISGLYINRPVSDYQALFGYCMMATITNLHLNNVSVNGSSHVGSTIGWGLGSVVHNCSSSGEVVSLSGYYVGGLAGRIDSYASFSSNITDCYSSCDVTGHGHTGGLIGYLLRSILSGSSSSGNINNPDGSNTGGLVGYAERSQISQCFSNATIAGDGVCGGLIGFLFSDSSSDYSIASECYFAGTVNGSSSLGGLIGGASGYVRISDSYNAGIVSGTFHIGGAFGYIESATITNCYSYGAVTGDEYTGGLIGYNTESSVTRSYWDTQSSGQATSAGGNGKTTAEMQDVMTFLAGGWDIKGAGDLGIWNQGNGRNNGYPYLDWEYPDDPANPAVTTPYAPVLSTQACTEIGATCAVFNGTIISTGNPAASAYGFCWNTSGEPTIADSLFDLGTAGESGAYSALVESLSMNTLYYARAFATNGSGTAYGEEIQFQTLPLAAIQPIGTGSEADPYLISSLANLYWVSRENQANSGFDGKCLKQTADIDASSTQSWIGDQGWEPIGSSTSFRGTYDGDGHEISGLYINRPVSDYQALFGYCM
ncbi:MAG: LamG domain-containing protein, partial [Candidatus Cloacimonetes bacterium]|nr:LamG domain-containing protein [Candidatus Cloacimonadota bacterium]